ncbi:YkgJ family cysteine cluster protein [Porticoccaceae bacterium LTM1]|nr:YkgJ family cysteine cluster protein [Porticoccaceae bacterium LTM1]
MNCRPNCGACCIAPSINHPLPGMPKGKPAGVICVNLDADTRQCKIWDTEQYPDTCRHFLPAEYVCGESREEAIRLIGQLEEATR